ncbi:PAS domain S-box protein, partial [Candidatus Dependentiae bacterium]|nr:PAS domain S-box protein [Candidatus Dependentiae bacterium]
MKIKNKIIIIFFVSFILVLAAVDFISKKYLESEKFNSIAQNYLKQLQHIDFAITQFLTEVEHKLLQLAENPDVRFRNDSKFTNFLNADEKTFKYNITKDEQRIIDIFYSLKVHNPYISSVYMGRQNGSFVRSHKRAKPTKYDPRERPWYKLAYLNKATILRTEPYSAVTTSDINIGTVTTISDSEGVYGVVGIDITLTDLSSYISSVKFGDNGFILLFDENFNVLTAPDTSILLKKDNEIPELFSGMKKLKSSNRGYFITDYGTQKYYCYHYLSEKTGWKLCGMIPEKELTGSIKNYIRTIQTIIAVSFMILALLILMLNKKIVLTPIEKLRSAVMEIYNTGSYIQLEKNNRKDEIGDLIFAFNSMIGSLEKKQRELNISETRFRRLFDNSLEGIFRIDDSGIIIDVNAAFVNMFMFKNNGEPVNEKNEFNQLFVDSSNFNELMSILKKDGNIRDFESAFYRQNGQIFYAVLSLCAVQSVNTSELVYEGLIIDISEHKHKELLLLKDKEHIESKFWKLIQCMGEGFVYTGVDGIIEYMNDKSAEIFKTGKSDAINKKISDFINSKDVEEFEKYILNLRDDGNTQFAAELKNNNSEKQYVLISARPVKEETEISGYVIIITDITYLKKIENELRKAKQETEAANSAKSVFLANVSHEIRTPMNAIMGMAYLTLQTELNSEQRKNLENISYAAKSLLRIINDILDISKIEAGKIEIENIEFSIDRMVENVSSI